MTCQHQNLGGAYDWLKQISLVARPIEALPRRHQNGIFVLVPQTSITGNTSVVSRIVGCFLRRGGGVGGGGPDKFLPLWGLSKNLCIRDAPEYCLLKYMYLQFAFNYRRLVYFTPLYVT